MIQAQSIRCALHDRVFTLPIDREVRSWRGIFLTSGSGIIRAEDEELSFSATSLVCSPWSSEMSLWIGAGSVGAHFTVSGNSLSNAIGHNAESSELRLITDRLIAVQFEPDNSAMVDCSHAFDLILREFGARGSGSTSMIEAQVRAILVTLWRNTSSPDSAPKSIGRTQSILRHYRQLVETHFRDHWPISKYADKIGISPDRLHDICSRNLGKTPSQLLHERTMLEASTMLENTTLSVEQLASVLGFADSAYFSRFFRARAGLPPAKYRRKAVAGSDPELSNVLEGYADWP